LRRFKGFDTCIRTISLACKCLTRLADNRSLPVRACRQLSSGLLNAVLSNKRIAELLDKCLADLKAQRSIPPSYFQSLVDSDDYECLIDPVDVVGCEKAIAFTIPILRCKFEAGFSVVVGVVVGYKGSDAQTTIDVVYEVGFRTFSSQKSWLIDSIFEPQHYVDQASDSFSPFPQVRKACLKPLYRICGLHNLPPRAMQIELLNDPAGIAFYRGGFADVFKCMGQSMEVAVKVLRTYRTSDLQKITRVSYYQDSISFCVDGLTITMQKYYKEAIAWKSLCHPNVLPLLGVPKDRSQFEFAMVSEWMTNGTINEFVRAHRDVNRFKLVCFPCTVLLHSLIAQNYATSVVCRRR